MCGHMDHTVYNSADTHPVVHNSVTDHNLNSDHSSAPVHNSDSVHNLHSALRHSDLQPATVQMSVQVLPVVLPVMFSQIPLSVLLLYVLPLLYHNVCRMQLHPVSLPHSSYISSSLVPPLY